MHIISDALWVLLAYSGLQCSSFFSFAELLEEVFCTHSAGQVESSGWEEAKWFWFWLRRRERGKWLCFVYMYTVDWWLHDCLRGIVCGRVVIKVHARKRGSTEHVIPCTCHSMHMSFHAHVIPCTCHSMHCWALSYTLGYVRLDCYLSSSHMNVCFALNKMCFK